MGMLRKGGQPRNAQPEIAATRFDDNEKKRQKDCIGKVESLEGVLDSSVPKNQIDDAKSNQWTDAKSRSKPQPTRSLNHVTFEVLFGPYQWTE